VVGKKPPRGASGSNFIESEVEAVRLEPLTMCSQLDVRQKGFGGNTVSISLLVNAVLVFDAAVGSPGYMINADGRNVGGVTNFFEIWWLWSI